MIQTKKNMMRLANGGWLLILTGVSILPATGATWCVNTAASSGCKATIGAAISAAAANDTVLVSPGTYAESVAIGKPLSLIGADANKTIIDASNLGVGIYVDGIDHPGLANVFVSGFTVQNAQFEGILITNASSVTVSNNVLSGNDKALTIGAAGPACPGIPAFETGEDFDCGEAIHLSGVDHSTVNGNTVQNNAGGILLSDDTGATHDNVIFGNVVTNNPSDCGITLASHPPAAFTNATNALGVFHNAIIGNQSSQNGLKGEGAGVGIFASAPSAANYANVVMNNQLTGNDLPGVAIHGHTPNQNLNNNVIIGNQISGNGPDTDDAATPGPTGIVVSGIDPITGTIISGNTISQQAVDVAIFAPGDARVQRNTFTGGIGIANLGRGGVVNGDGNWWGCNYNPAFPIAAFAGCATVSGAVNVGYWTSSAFSK
ncbi:MAG: NosD domain-containing protein [Candidatus Solibacter sp.]